jgi:hypothetical protein
VFPGVQPPDPARRGSAPGPRGAWRASPCTCGLCLALGRHSVWSGRHLGEVAQGPCTLAGIDGGRQHHVNQPGVVGVRSTVGRCQRPTKVATSSIRETELCRGVLAQPDGGPRLEPTGPGTARRGPVRPRRPSD